ncbi:MAG: hypothetical protein NDI69_14225 [Bacteriovoracaceae bacterium]|nr:hypothetical protein [Bacteriovoracaceae bacterium]
MNHSKKLLSLLTVMLFSANSWSHGLIEKIDCRSIDQDLQFYGVEIESESDYELQFHINSKSLGYKDLGVATFTLEDVFLNNQIVEKIEIPFNEIGLAKLLIPENYEQKERLGSGELKIPSLGIDSVMECLVVYE